MLSPGTPANKVYEASFIKSVSKHPKNYYGEGFGSGAIIASVSGLYYNRYIPFIPLVSIAQVEILASYATLSIIAIGLTVISAKRRKAVFGTFIDGLILGAVTVFDILVIVIQVLHGKFPFPMNFMYV